MMSRKTVGVLVAAMILIAGCSGGPTDNSPSTTTEQTDIVISYPDNQSTAGTIIVERGPDPTINLSDGVTASISNVTHDVTVSDFRSTMDIHITGEFTNASLNVRLSEGDTEIAKTIILEEDLADGAANVSLPIEEGPITSSKTYQLQVSSVLPTDDESHTETISISGPQVKIQSPVFITAGSGENKQISRAIFAIKNTGDVPAQVTDLEVSVNGNTGDSLVRANLEPGERLKVDSQNSTENSMLIMPELSSGENTVVLKVYSGDEVVAQYEDTI